MLDEPSVGLHPLGVRVLLGIRDRLVKTGATVHVIEHDLDMIANVDWIIDMGLGGGEACGRVIATGTPAQVSSDTGPAGSATGRYLAAARRDRIGYVFQNFGLIPVLSAAESVEMPLRLRHMERGQRDERVAEVLELVGLIRHAGQRPGELSGGQQQRVGVARALVARPEVLIADEPTGQLDSETAERIMDLILEVTRIRGTATVVATHDPLLISRADEVLELRDGRVVAGHPG